MNKLKLNSKHQLFGHTYQVKSISRSGVLFTLVNQGNTNTAPELSLSLKEVEDLVLL